jgi:putative oxidoreductase
LISNGEVIMKGLREKLTGLLGKFDSISLLFFRLTLAYGFYGPAMKKLGNIEGIAKWFESMGFIYPTLNAYLATATESLGVVLLFLGLGTRLISLPLMIVMVVAIGAVHWPHGFSASNNGFEIPLYYLLMLFCLFVRGPGCISLDAWACGQCKSSDTTEK